MKSSRRKFISSASAIVAGAGISMVFASTLATFPQLSSPADTIRIGAIDVSGMGWADLTAILKNPLCINPLI